MTDLPPVSDAPVLFEVEKYLGSPEGQQRIRTALQRRRLPSCFDVDITETVAAEARRFLLRGGSISSVPGWCHARITARVIDLARGVVPHEISSYSEEDQGAGASSEFSSPGRGELAGLRRVLLDLPASPEHLSAALSVIARVADEAVLDPGCPQPVAGATPYDAAIWAGLWYARVDGCFGSDAATRRRRSRAAQKVRELLACAVKRRGDG